MSFSTDEESGFRAKKGRKNCYINNFRVLACPGR